MTASNRLRERATDYLQRAERGEIDDPLMLAAVAQTFGVAGLPAARMARLAARALKDKRLAEFPVAYVGAAVVMGWADEFEMAARVQDAGIADAQRRGSGPLFMQASCFRGETALRAGELRDAEAHLRAALPIARELGADRFAAVFFIPVLLELGRIGEAAELLCSVVLADAELSSWQGVVVLAHRGRVRIHEGHCEAGVADLLDADERMSAGGCDLSVLCDWLPAAAGALAQLGRRDEATALAERERAAASAFGAPRRLGVALSTCGMLEPGEAGLRLLRDAVAVLERSHARLEHARALVCLGVWLRARGQPEQAREPLRRGLDFAQRCGAVVLAERARAELVGTGARPRRRMLSGPESLTPAELRTARMAAQGLSNREIAQALFVSAKTVEWQLSHAYAKLEIRGRTQLPAALSTAT